MPVLSNPRHEAFCQWRVKGEPAEHAYVLAGYERSRSNAARVNGYEHIRQRIAEILETQAAYAGVTAETIAEQLDEDRRLAHEKGNVGAAVAATMGKAKLFGLLVEKAEVAVKHSFADLSDDELEFQIAALAGEQAKTVQ